MATLNTLRTKGGFIVSIVIGISLIAFLLGDLTSGGGMLGGRQSRIGEIAGTPIDYMEYAQESDYMTSIAQLLGGTSALNEQQAEQARQMAWDALVQRYSFLPGFEQLGVAAGEAEQQDMVGGVYVSPMLEQMFANPATGAFDAQLLANFMASKDSDPSGNAQMIWDYLKEQMISQRLMTKYLSLVANGMMVTDLEVARGLKAAGESYSARYISQGYQTIADSTIKLTNSEIRSYYNQHKERFRQGESRSVEYVLFEMSPSAEDYRQAAEQIATVAEEFAAAGDAMAYAELNSQVRPDVRYVKREAIDPTFAATILAGDVYGPQLTGDVYTMARLGGSHTLPDSLGARHILLPLTDSLVADSLIRELRSGRRDFQTLAALHSLDQQARGGDLGRFTPEEMVPEVADALVAHRAGEIFTVRSPFGIHVMELTYKAAPVTKYQVATLIYNVEPSPATESAIYGQASAFLSQAAGSSAKFDAAVDGSGGTLYKRSARIANTDRNVSGLQNSLEMVRWAYNQKKAGVVSEIMEVGGSYVVATLTEIRHAGIAPVEQAAQAIRQMLVREKKAEQLAAKMQGASLEAVASALGASIDTVRNVQMGSFFLDGVGLEPHFIGAICSSKQGVVSKPVEGASGVYVFEVLDVASADNGATPESERVRLEAMTQSYIGERVNQALIEASEIEDMRVKFF